ncbi:MAG: AarF/UbiB family protein [Firmicutes bacterium]|nr:AarF/UbiB family protein [Bacillota bacterium]
MKTSRLGRTLAIFRLALSFWGDSRRINRARRRDSEALFRQHEEEIYRQGAVRFRETALSLGGLIIKVGQFLSARTDLLPLAFTRELAALQDQVPPAPWEAVKELMEEAWGKPLDALFTSIEMDPVAAASLGQVHRATLPDGTAVAVKVQRPDIVDLAQIDLSALGIIMRVLERYTRAGRRINAHRLFEEFSTLVGQELDYRQEEAHLRRFAENFSQDPNVRVPRSWPDMTRERVFVMEYVSGGKLTDRNLLQEWGLNPGHLGDLLIEAYLKQIALYGFVQIDPHPGNFFADPEGRIIFLDFGMMADIPERELASVAGLVQAVLTRDATGVVNAVDQLGFIRSGASLRLLQKAVDVMLDQFSGTPLSPGPQLDRAVADFQDFLYEEPLEFPARYMFLGRAIGMLFGLVSTLNPGIDWMAVLKNRALPILEERERGRGPSWADQAAGLVGRLLGENAGRTVGTVASLGWREAQNWVKVPGQLRRVLSLLETGDLATQPEMTGVMRRLDRLGDLGEARLHALWAMLALLAAAAMHIAWPRAEWAAWVAAIVAGLLLVRSWWDARRARRRTKRRR